jgi:hypothetical protein
MKDLPRSGAWLSLWWLVWAAALLQQLAMSLPIWQADISDQGVGFAWTTLLLLSLPLVAGMGIRWLVCPWLHSPVAGFFAHLAGIALCGASGFLSIVIEVPHQQAAFALCCVGLLQFVPLRHGPWHWLQRAA